MRRLKTFIEFKNYLVEIGAPAVLEVHPDDYAVIKHKFVHRDDWFADSRGFFVVCYLDVQNSARKRPVIIREAEDVERLGCEG